MANSTDKSILTAAGKALLAQLNAEEKALVIDKMIFANVPNRPEYPQPDDVVPTDHIVHQEQVEQRGRLSADSVIYSTTLTSDVGPFDFNWTGAYCSEYGVLVTIDHHALTPKTADEPGVAGNTLVRSVVLEYKDIAEITNITVDASSWQYNATERMKKMDSDVAQSIIDQNGKDWFIEDGFLVTPSGSAYSIKAGAGYVSGNRVAMEFDRSVQIPNKPSFIYIDAHREGTPTGEQVTLFNFVVTAEEKDDYTDENGAKHFVCKIAQVLGDGSVSDLRPEGESADKAWVDKRISERTDLTFNTLSELLSSSDFNNGMRSTTKGYYQSGDGGGAQYINRGQGWPEVADGYVTHANLNGDYIELVPGVTGINVLQCGSKPEQGFDNALSLQAGVDFCILRKETLHFKQATYESSESLLLGGKSVQAAGLQVDGHRATLVITQHGEHGVQISRSQIRMKNLNVRLPIDADGTGGHCVHFVSGVGNIGWVHIENGSYTHGKHGIYSNQVPLFASTFEKNRVFNTYSSHIKVISDGVATTLSFRNNQTAGQTDKEPAWYFNIENTGNGVENLELTMNSADDVTRALLVRSRYVTIDHFYSERIRGAEWEDGFSLFDIRDTYENGRVHGLRTSFISKVPADKKDVCSLRVNGFFVNACRLIGGLDDTVGQSVVRTGDKTTELLNCSLAGADYQIYAGGPVIGGDNGYGSGNLSVDPTSPGRVVEKSHWVNIKTQGYGSGNDTGESGIVFMIDKHVVSEGAIRNGQFLKPQYAYAAILPYSPGGGSNRKGGLHVYTNPSSAGETTPVNVATWDLVGNYVPGSDDSYSLGSASRRWANLYAATDVISTSDENLKTQVEVVSEAEHRVAKKIKCLFKRFKFKDAVGRKGDVEARVHFGVLAQDVEQAFVSEGLDPNDYALFCRDSWYEMNGNYIELTEEDTPPEGAVEVSQLGIRYSELLCFVISSI